MIEGRDRGCGGSANSLSRRNVDDAARLMRFHTWSGECVSLDRHASRTALSVSFTRSSSFFFSNPTKSTTIGTRDKTTNPILWYNAPSQADSAQNVRSTFGEADSSHAMRRGRRRSWRHPRREGRRWSTRGWHTGCHPRDILPAATSALSPRSRTVIPRCPHILIDLPSSLPS